MLQSAPHCFHVVWGVDGDVHELIAKKLSSFMNEAVAFSDLSGVL